MAPHSPFQADLSSSVLSHYITTEIHWRQSIHMKNNWFSSPVPHLLSLNDFVCDTYRESHQKESAAAPLLGHSPPPLPSPPPFLLPHLISRSVAVLFINLADATAFSGLPQSAAAPLLRSPCQPASLSHGDSGCSCTPLSRKDWELQQLAHQPGSCTQSLKKGEFSERFTTQWRTSVASSQNRAAQSFKWIQV